MADPMHQFQIHNVVDLSAYSFTVPGTAIVVDPSITNSVMSMLIAAGLVIAFFTAVTLKPATVPGRLQTVGESLFGLVDNLTSSIIGHEGKSYFPYVFTLFLFILSMNLLGLFTLFGPTGQLAVTATLAIMTVLVVVGVGFAKNGLGFFKLFVPSGVPAPILLIIVPIEFISFLLRPLTLALRLFGNMIGGHIALGVFGGFVVSLGALAAGGGLGFLGIPGAVVSFGGVLALTALECLVSFLQAFVFTVLACIYLNDVVNLGHGH